VGLRPLFCWDCGFETRRGHGSLSLLSVVCCQVGVSATNRSLVQKSSTDCGVSECDLETSTMRRPRPIRAVEPWKNSMKKLATAMLWFLSIVTLSHWRQYRTSQPTAGWQRYVHELKQILLDYGCVNDAMVLQFVRKTVCSQVIERCLTNGNFQNPVTSEYDLEERSKQEFSVAVPTVACRSGLRYRNGVFSISFASERWILRTQTGCVDMKLLETCSFWECEMH